MANTMQWGTSLPMRPLTNGTGARLAAAIALLTAAVAGCASPAPGASAPGAGGPAATGQVPVPGSRTLGSPIPSSISSPRYISGPLPAEPTGPVPAVKGCPSGTVAITHYPDDPDETACITAGSRIRLTLPNGRPMTWSPPQVKPAGAATVASMTDSAGTMHAMVTPAGTAAFCLSMTLSDASPTDPITIWRLCVTIRR